MAVAGARVRWWWGSVSSHARPGPIFPGREAFAGTAYSFRAVGSLGGSAWASAWPSSGPAASAIQFIPPVAEEAGQLTVFQRSAPYLLPRLDGPYGALNRFLFGRMPGYDRPFRYAIWKLADLSTDVFDEGDSPMHSLFLRVTRWHLERQVKDPELRRKLTPDYPIGCKRVLFSSDYYPALQRENVHLEPQGIDHIHANGIRTKDGRDHGLRRPDLGDGLQGHRVFSLRSASLGAEVLICTNNGRAERRPISASRSRTSPQSLPDVRA